MAFVLSSVNEETKPMPVTLGGDARIRKDTQSLKPRFQSLGRPAISNFTSPGGWLLKKYSKYCVCPAQETVAYRRCIVFEGCSPSTATSTCQVRLLSLDFVISTAFPNVTLAANVWGSVRSI